MADKLEDVRYREFTSGEKEFYSDLRVGSFSHPEMVVYKNDFISSADYMAEDWTITSVDTDSDSAVVRALAGDELYGALVITTNNNAADSESLQLDEETWKLVPGKKLWCEFRFKVNDADQVDCFLGLAITDTTPLDATDRIGFRITDESGSIAMQATKNSETTSEDTEIDAADNDYVIVGFRYDGSSQVDYYVNKDKKGSITTNLPDDENLAITLHLKNGEAAAQSLTVDYIFVAAER